jgi:DNA replication licensing factor MCM3
MQADNVARTQPVTARSLETLIRLSTAHAKCRLSKTVDIQDAQAAIELVQYAYFKKVLKKERRRKRSKGSDVEGSESEEEVETVDDEQEPRKKRGRSERSRKQPGEDGYDPYEYDDEGIDVDAESVASKPRRQSASIDKEVESTDGASTILPDRLKAFKSSLFYLFKQERSQSLALDLIRRQVNLDNDGAQFDDAELMAAINKMQEDNQIMLSENFVFLI